MLGGVSSSEALAAGLRHDCYVPCMNAMTMLLCATYGHHGGTACVNLQLAIQLLLSVLRI
jgi:hypothetical protein